MRVPRTMFGTLVHKLIREQRFNFFFSALFLKLHQAERAEDSAEARRHQSERADSVLSKKRRRRESEREWERGRRRERGAHDVNRGARVARVFISSRLPFLCLPFSFPQGLLENLRVRRAGFCYRNTYEKWIKRYYMLTPKTFPDWHRHFNDDKGAWNGEWKKIGSERRRKKEREIRVFFFF